MEAERVGKRTEDEGETSIWVLFFVLYDPTTCAQHPFAITAPRNHYVLVI